MKHYKKTQNNISKIVKVLKAAPQMGKDYLTIGEIARESKLHKWTVSRTIDIFMHPFLDMIVPDELGQIGLKIKLVKLKSAEITEKQVLMSLDVRV